MKDKERIDQERQRTEESPARINQRAQEEEESNHAAAGQNESRGSKGVVGKAEQVDEKGSPVGLKHEGGGCRYFKLEAPVVDQAAQHEGVVPIVVDRKI